MLPFSGHVRLSISSELRLGRRENDKKEREQRNRYAGIHGLESRVFKVDERGCKFRLEVRRFAGTREPTELPA